METNPTASSFSCTSVPLCFKFVTDLLFFCCVCLRVWFLGGASTTDSGACVRYSDVFENPKFQHLKFYFKIELDPAPTGAQHPGLASDENVCQLTYLELQRLQPELRL